VIGAYDAETGTVTYTDRSPSDSVSYTGGAAQMFGQESWKWLLLGPLSGEQ
jgi:phospholipid/cholesterol/gamma-HCH transport system substrate-binding protein